MNLQPLRNMKPFVVGCHNVDKTCTYKSTEIRKKLKQKCVVYKDKHRVLERKWTKMKECFTEPIETCHERNSVILLMIPADLHGVGSHFLAHASC